MKFPGSSEPKMGREPSPENGGYEIVELSANEWQELRDFRLRAIADSPRAFGNTLEQTRAMKEDEWKQLFVTGKYFVAREGGNIVGMICMVREREASADHIVNIYSLYVAPEARRRGIASALLSRVKDELSDGYTHKIRLRVDSESDGAKSLYENMGFKEVGYLKDEMRLGDEFVDKRIMEKFLQ